MSRIFTIEEARKGAKTRAEMQRKVALEKYENNKPFCMNCNKPLEIKNNQQVCLKLTRKFCSPSCTQLFRWRKLREKLNLPEPKKREKVINSVLFKTKKEVNYQQINQHARRVYYSKFKEPNCELCGYSNFVDVAHIKAIRDFSENDKLVEISCIKNLIGLCPNCHREYDKGLLDSSIIQKALEKRL